MIGVGAVAGTLSGGHTNARPPDVVAAGIASDNHPSVTPAPATQRTRESTTVREAVDTAPQSAPASTAPAPTAAAVIALRFPRRWQADTAVEPTAAAPQVMAFAAEPQRSERQAPAQTSGYNLASVDPAPPMPKRVTRPVQPKQEVLFNDAQLASIKARLHLTRDQEQHWPQVEQALRAISWRLATQQDAKRPVRGNRAAMIDPNSPEVARLKSAAFPLIMSLRADQKQEVRQLAHTMGLSNVAAMF